MCEVVLNIQSCGCKGFEEIRVAFGDMNNCQLKCPFCFTREQKPANDFLSNLSKKPLNNVKIRVIGVDTMEYKHPQKSYVVKKLGVENISCLDYYGEQAYLFAREVLENSMINVQEVRKDKYGRTLAYVTVCNETACYDYGELLLEKGLAIVYEYEDFEKKQEYKEIQEEAKKRKLGLWSCT